MKSKFLMNSSSYGCSLICFVFFFSTHCFHFQCAFRVHRPHKLIKFCYFTLMKFSSISLHNYSFLFTLNSQTRLWKNLAYMKLARNRIHILNNLSLQFELKITYKRIFHEYKKIFLIQLMY